MEGSLIRVTCHLGGGKSLPDAITVKKGSTVSQVVEELKRQRGSGRSWSANSYDARLRDETMVGQEFVLLEDTSLWLFPSKTPTKKRATSDAAAVKMEPPPALPHIGLALPNIGLERSDGRSEVLDVSERVGNTGTSLNGQQVAQLISLLSELSLSNMPEANGEANEELDALILIPLPEEWRAFQRVFAIDVSRATTCGPFLVVKFDGGKNRCAAAWSGSMGLSSMALLTEKLTSLLKPKNVVLFGIAGSLDAKDAMVGDVVIAEEVRTWTHRGAITDVKKDNDGIWLKVALGGESFRPDNALSKRVYDCSVLPAGWFDNWRTERLQRLVDLLGVNPRPNGVRDFSGSASVVQFGHIASGDFVSKSTGFATFLKEHQDRNLIAVEMESGGLLKAVAESSIKMPVIVIRGVSDPGNEHKAALDQVGGGAFRIWAAENAGSYLQHFLKQNKLL